MGRHDFLVGGDDVLAGFERAAQVLLGGLDAAEDFDDDVDVRIVDHGRRVGGEAIGGYRRVAGLIRIAHERALNSDRAAKLPLQGLGALVQVARDRRPDIANAEQAQAYPAGHSSLTLARSTPTGGGTPE